MFTSYLTTNKFKYSVIKMFSPSRAHWFNVNVILQTAWKIHINRSTIYHENVIKLNNTHLTCLYYYFQPNQKLLYWNNSPYPKIWPDPRPVFFLFFSFHNVVMEPVEILGPVKNNMLLIQVIEKNEKDGLFIFYFQNGDHFTYLADI